MSAIDVNNTIISMQNATAQTAATTASTTDKTKMDADMFLKLMLEQLKYQDPMDPVDNKEFLAQQAQFTQVSETQELNASIAKNNNIMQTLALVGKEVTMVDPDNSQNLITGVVSEASFDSSGSAVTVDGTSYPLSSIQSVRNAESVSSSK